MFTKWICSTLLTTVLMTGPGRSADESQALGLLRDGGPAALANIHLYADTVPAKLRAHYFMIYDTAVKQTAQDPLHPSDVKAINRNFANLMVMDQNTNFAPRLSGSNFEFAVKVGGQLTATVGMVVAPPQLSIPLAVGAFVFDNFVPRAAVRLDAQYDPKNWNVMTSEQSEHWNRRGIEFATANPTAFVGFEPKFMLDHFDRPAIQDPAVEAHLTADALKGRMDKNEGELKALRHLIRSVPPGPMRFRLMTNQVSGTPSPEAYHLLNVEADRESKTDLGEDAETLNGIRTSLRKHDLEMQDLKMRDRSMQPYILMSNFARLAGDPVAADRFAKVAQIRGAIHDLPNAIRNIASDPFRVVNLYLFIATTAIDLFQQQKDSDTKILVDELRAVARQVEDLRKQMHERFDELESRLDGYFYRTFVDLDRIKDSLASLRAASVALSTELDQIKTTVEWGFDQKVQQDMIDLSAKCLPRDSSGSLYKIKDVPAANQCVAGFMAYAAGVPRRFSAKLPGNLGPTVYADLMNTVSTYSGLPVPPASFDQYFVGTASLAVLLNLNRAMVPIAREGRPAGVLNTPVFRWRPWRPRVRTPRPSGKTWR